MYDCDIVDKKAATARHLAAYRSATATSNQMERLAR